MIDSTNTTHIEIRHVQSADKAFWFTLDKHMSDAEFENKVRDKRGYVLLADARPIGILRYNLFWDNLPFCTLLYIDNRYRNSGFGKALMRHWETEMRSIGYDKVLTSTRADEQAQYFYRAIGYTDCGKLTLSDEPIELILCKCINHRN